MRRLFTCIYLYLVVSLFAFGQTGDDLLSPVRTSLDQQFSGLDKSRVPKGLLLDYAIDLVDLDLYNGVALLDSNYVDIDIFESILRSVYSASVINTPPFPDTPDGIMEDLIDSYSSSTIPVGLIAYEYNYIRADALSCNLIEYDSSTGRVSDKYAADSTWIDPYTSAFAVGFAPVVGSHEGASVTYSFTLDSFFTNMNVSLVEFDAGDGYGYRQISLPSSVSTLYSLGTHDLKIRLTVSGNQTLLMHSRIQILPEPVTTSSLASSPAYDFKTSFTSRISQSGYTPSATVYVKYAPSNTSDSLQKPFIVVEGFDPIRANDQPTSLGMKGRGKTNIATFLNLSAIDSSGVDYIKNIYDIVYIDWDKSVAPIQTNADILEQVIQWINSIKSATADKNIVFGQSMGGLIARYALRKMEQSTTTHDCSAYVSHDTPHLGANVPLGFICFVRSIMNMLHQSGSSLLGAIDFFSSIGDFFGNETSGTVQDILELENAPSFLQMSYFNVLESGSQLTISSSTHDIWLQILSSLGFPEGENGEPILNLAISNGGNDTDLSLPYPLLEMSADVRTGFLTNFLALLVGVCPDISTTSIRFSLDAVVLPYYSSSCQVCQIVLKYNKKHAWLVNGSTHYLINRTFTAPADSFPIESAKGSYYNISTPRASGITDWGDIVDFLIGAGNYEFLLRNNFMFIPTVSSLCYKGGALLQSSDYNLDFSSGDVLSYLLNTPFNGYYAEMNATRHISLLPEMGHWLVDVLGYKINGSLHPADGDVFSVSSGTPAGVWSSSNESVATVNNSGEISIVGEGSANICYDGTFNYYGTVRPFHLTRRIEFGLPQFRLTNTRLNGPIIGPPVGGGLILSSPKPWIEYNRATAERTSTNFQVDETYMEKYWCKVDSLYYGTDSLTWVQTTGYSYDYEFWEEAVSIFFKYRYRGNESQVYSMRLMKAFELPTLMINASGEIIMEDNILPMDSASQTKTDVVDSYTITAAGIDLNYAYLPSGYTVITDLLEKTAFKNLVREMEPWGERKYLVVPVRLKDNNSGEEEWSSINFVHCE